MASWGFTLLMKKEGGAISSWKPRQFKNFYEAISPVGGPDIGYTLHELSLCMKAQPHHAAEFFEQYHELLYRAFESGNAVRPAMLCYDAIFAHDNTLAKDDLVQSRLAEVANNNFLTCDFCGSGNKEVIGIANRYLIPTNE